MHRVQLRLGGKDAAVPLIRVVTLGDVMVDGNRRIVDQAPPFASQPQRERKLPEHLRARAAKAPIKPSLVQQCGAHRQVHPLEHVHVARRSGAEVVVADDATKPLHETHVGAVTAFARLPVTTAGSANLLIIETRGQTRDPVCVRFGIVIRQRDHFSFAEVQGGIHRRDHTRLRGIGENNGHGATRRRNDRCRLGIADPRPNDDFERRMCLRGDCPQAARQIRGAPPRGNDHGDRQRGGIHGNRCVWHRAMGLSMPRCPCHAKRARRRIPSVPEPLHIIRPAESRWLPDLAEVWAFRDLCIALGKRDITLRYRQTILGIVWVVLQPMIAGGVFSVVFGRVAKLQSGTDSYFLFAYAGFVAWNAFQNTLSRAAGSVLGQGNLVTKVFFPRLVLPISSVMSAAVDFGVGAASLALIMAMNGSAPGLAVLTAPLWVALLMAMGLGLGTMAAALSVRFRDVQHALPVFVQLLLYASPVAYATMVVPEAVRPFFLLNPLTGVLDGFRWAVLNTAAPDPIAVSVSIAGTLAALAAGAMLFARTERQIADVI